MKLKVAQQHHDNQLTFAYGAPAVLLLHSRPVADLAPVPSVKKLLVRMVCEDLDHLLLGLAIQLRRLVGFLPDSKSEIKTAKDPSQQ